MADRVVAVADIARRKRNANVRLNRTAYRAASARSIVPCFGRKPKTNLEGFLFPATYEFLKDTTSRAARRRPDRRVLPQLAEGRHALRALEEPHAVRRAHDRVDGREGGEGAGGAQADRRRDLQPAAPADGARHRRDAALRARHPADRVDHAVAAAELVALQHALPGGPAADADRQPRPRLDPGGRAPGEGRLLYFARKKDHVHHFFTASSTEFNEFLAKNGYG